MPSISCNYTQLKKTLLPLFTFYLKGEYRKAAQLASCSSSPACSQRLTADEHMEELLGQFDRAESWRVVHLQSQS